MKKISRLQLLFLLNVQTKQEKLLTMTFHPNRSKMFCPEKKLTKVVKVHEILLTALCVTCSSHLTDQSCNHTILLLQEGSCILTGLTYNGKDENGNNLWDGCANIYIRKYESASSCQQVITSFNVNTNRWMAK